MSEARKTGFLERRGAVVLFLLALLLLLPGNNILPLLDRDEPRFARATVEMIQRGEWFVPYFNDDYRFDKPVLTYWLMRAGYALFGVNEFGARFHSVISAALLVVVMFFMGRRWFGARAGFLAGFGMLTCFQMAVHGRSAVADMPMVLLVCLSMWAMAELLGICGRSLADATSGTEHNVGERRGAWFWVFYISLGLGFLAKGPIALIVPLLGALLWRFVIWRQPAAWRALRLQWGIPIVLAIVGTWGIPALIKTHGLFWKVGIGEHVVERGMRAFNGRFPFPLYYVFTMFLSLLPWGFFVRDAWHAGSGRINGGRKPLETYLMAWFLSPFLVFSLYSTQLPHYIMPGFPAFFLLLARAWTTRPETDSDRRFWRKLRIGGAMAVVFVAFVFALGLVLRPRTPALQLQAFLENRPMGTEFAFYRFREPSLIFYSGRHFDTLGHLDDVLAFMSKPGPRMLVAEVSSRKIAGQKADDFSSELALIETNGVEIMHADGIRVAQSRFVTVRAIFKQ